MTTATEQHLRRPTEREPQEGVELGFWQMYRLHVPFYKIDADAPWFYRYEPIEDEV